MMKQNKQRDEQEDEMLNQIEEEERFMTWGHKTEEKGMKKI